MDHTKNVLTEEWIVPAGQRPERLDVSLCEHLKRFSRSKIRNIIDEGLVLVNGVVVKQNHLLKPGEQVSMYSRYSVKGVISQQIPLDIIYEDDSLLVLNKEAGMACHPGLGIYKDTLLNAVKGHFEKTNDISSLENGLVHRLDRGTSGLMVVAKNEQAFQSLSEQFARKEAGRVYVARVWGQMPEKYGTINLPIGRDPITPEIIRVFNNEVGGKEAVTHYQVLEQHDVFSKVQFTLETGRTHQVRIHSHFCGCPVINDSRYTLPLSSQQQLHSNLFANYHGLYLHAAQLHFTHPQTHEVISFESKLPIKWTPV